MDKLEKIKKQSLILLISAGVAALGAAVFGVLVFVNLFSAGYSTVLWQLPVSLVFCYTALLLALRALDLRLAVRVLPAIEKLELADTKAVADALGWRERETAAFIKRLKKLKLISEE